MQIDIVERLREATVPRLEMGWPAPHVVQRKEPLWMEAADEIERLRAELAKAIKQRDEAHGLIRNWQTDLIRVINDSTLAYVPVPTYDMNEADKRAFLAAMRKGVADGK